MNKLKKWVCMMLSLMLVMSLAGCISSGTQKPIVDNATQGNTTVQLASTETTSAPQEKAVTIENTVLIEKDGVVITAKELVKDAIWGLGVKVLIENNTDKNISVSLRSLVVNNYMITDLFSSSVAAGKKANDTMYLSSAALEAAGIETISDIAMVFHIYNSDTYEGIFDSDEIELKTSAYGMVEQAAADDGKELYNKDGIRIVGKYVSENSFWGAGVLLFIENKYGSNITVQVDNMSINGFMVNPIFSCNVNDGRMALSDITIMSTDLEANDITSVDTIELSFRVFNTSTFTGIVETDPITFETN